jgi:hypothetical protein
LRNSYFISNITTCTLQKNCTQCTYFFTPEERHEGYEGDEDEEDYEEDHEKDGDEEG